jgi:hypothetical protein
MIAHDDSATGPSESGTEPPSAPAPVRRRYGCGGCLLAFIVPLLALIGLGVWAFTGAVRLEPQARQFVRLSVVPALQTWDYAALNTISAEELKTSLMDSNTTHMLEAFRAQLGPLQSLDDRKAAWNFFRSGVTDSVTYRFPAQFEKTSGTLELKVIKVGRKWQLLSFSAEHVCYDALKGDIH